MKNETVGAKAEHLAGTLDQQLSLSLYIYRERDNACRDRDLWSEMSQSLCSYWSSVDLKQSASSNWWLEAEHGFHPTEPLTVARDD